MTTKSILSILVLAITVLTFSNCDSNDGPIKSEEQLYLEQLTGTWTIEQVILDNKDVTEFYATTRVTFNNNRTYSVTNPVPNVWPGSGTFTMTKNISDSHFKLTRDDQIQITITELTNSDLTLSFQYDAPGGRTQSISGVYTFMMTR